MNAPLVVGVVSDVVCPWCYIGTRRFAKAVEIVRGEHPDFAVRLRWHPYFLNPDTPPEGEPYRPFLERKFGGADQVEALFERVRAAGRAVGIEFAFEKIALRANTLKAHRLIHWVQERGDAAPVVERLFAAQFLRGEYVGDPALLARIAGDCGFDAAVLRAYLESDEDEARVRDEARQFLRIGVSAVPTYIAGGRALTGAEDPAVLADHLRGALAA